MTSTTFTIDADHPLMLKRLPGDADMRAYGERRMRDSFMMPSDTADYVGGLSARHMRLLRRHASAQTVLIRDARQDMRCMVDARCFKPR